VDVLRRIEPALVAVVAVLLVLVPTASAGWWPTTPHGALFLALLLAGGVALAGWRRRPRAASCASLGLLLAAAIVGGPFPDPAVALLAAAFLLLGLAWPGRAAWAAAAVGAGCAVTLAAVTGMDTIVPALMITVPPFAVGTILRLRQEASARLAAAARELEEERELFAEIALRHERVRIAGSCTTSSGTPSA
jgi:signal transduction histidine kinase